jgi:hypothetical protein
MNKFYTYSFNSLTPQNVIIAGIVQAESQREASEKIIAAYNREGIAAEGVVPEPLTIPDDGVEEICRYLE